MQEVRQDHALKVKHQHAIKDGLKDKHNRKTKLLTELQAQMKAEIV